MMNKYVLGTIVGSALVGFTNKGSALKLVARETYDFTFKTTLVLKVPSLFRDLQTSPKSDDPSVWDLYTKSRIDFFRRKHQILSKIYDILNTNGFTESVYVDNEVRVDEDELRIIVNIGKTIYLPKNNDPSFWNLYMSISDKIMPLLKQIESMPIDAHLIQVNSLYSKKEDHKYNDDISYESVNLQYSKTEKLREWDLWEQFRRFENYLLPGKRNLDHYKARLPIDLRDVIINIRFRGLNAHVFNPDGSLYEPKITSSKLRKR